MRAPSQGGSVLDGGCADASERAAGRYYPKLQWAVPCTPVPGRRLLAKPGPGAAAAEAALAAGMEELAERHGLSSVHVTFLPEEQAENSKYMYELASARFGFSMEKLQNVQAFHFKGGQGAKTGTGGHLPGPKVQGKIAEVRGLEPGKPAVPPPRFPAWTPLEPLKHGRDEVR